MPELPEVQTVVGDLNKKVRGFTITDFWTDWAKSIKSPLNKFKKGIIGSKIKKVQRRGKHLLFFLDDDLVMVVHLKMTGHLLVKSQKSTKPKVDSYFSDRVNQYIHHRWKLELKTKNYLLKSSLEFSDLRKFGKIRLLKKIELAEDKELKGLGIEPLHNDFTFDIFELLLEKNKNKTIRNLLLDQSKIAGIGNIYVSEILFESKVLPTRKVGKLSSQEKRRIYTNIKKVLLKAVKHRGTSDSDYRDTSGKPGSFQNYLKVYNREDRKCRVCLSKIRRKKVNGRSSFHCPKCQI